MEISSLGKYERGQEGSACLHGIMMKHRSTREY